MSSTKQFGGSEVEGPGQLKQEIAGTEAGSRTSQSGESSGLLQKAGEAAKDVKTFAVNRAHDVQAVAKEKKEKVVALMKARPVESVLVGLALGYLLGWLSGKAVQSRTSDHRRLFRKW